MNNASPLFSVDMKTENAVAWFTDLLFHWGCSILRTFDLKVARQAHSSCACPNHGTSSCDCQMVVLLVYAQNGLPVTIVAHTFSGTTIFAIVEEPGRLVEPQIVIALRQLAEANLAQRTTHAGSFYAS